ncbi:MAG: 30S ribosomal protein S3 [Candidatus Altiarchaeota archaeon]|nr:30S ribosomal protein S3 [Candidatus Altiarchaeota archaeon]
MAMEKHFIQEGKIRSEIENYLKNELSGTGYSGINIQKTPLATRIILYVEKPPLVIGKKGKRINKLTKLLKTRYGIDNPAVDVQKIENPTLDPNIVVRRIALALERGMNRRRVVYKALRAVMTSGARGVEVILSGKIVGKGGRSRTEKYSEGYMKKAGDSLKLVQVGSTQAYLKAGIIGVRVKIVPPNAVFPDQISVIPKGAERVEKAEVVTTSLVEEAKVAEPVEKGEKGPEKEEKKEGPKPKEKKAKQEKKEKKAEKPEKKKSAEPAVKGEVREKTEKKKPEKKEIEKK